MKTNTHRFNETDAAINSLTGRHTDLRLGVCVCFREREREREGVCVGGMGKVYEWV